MQGSRLVTDPATLRAPAEELWRRLSSGESLSGDETEALAEAGLRLGTSASADAPTAVSWLWRAHYADPDDPRPVYHLGRRYLLAGHLDSADRWLSRAAEQLPTSPRIWALRSRLKRRRDESTRDEPGYDGGHKRRAEQILQAIRDGVAVPDPAATADAPGSPGPCRWPDVYPLDFDAGIRGETSARNRERLEPDLTAVAADAGERRGGTGAFAVLAVQWLVCGYPVAPVRRLLAGLPLDEPATELVSRVCMIVEAGPARAPELLAASLAADLLPDALVALLHHRLLLDRPLALTDPSAYVAAGQALQADPTGADPDHLAALRRALDELSGRSVALVEDEPATRPDADPAQLLAALETAAEQLTALTTDAKAFAKTVGCDGDPDRVLGDKQGAEAAADELAAVARHWLDEWGQLKQRGTGDSTLTAAELQERLERCQPRLQAVAAAKSVIRKIAAKKAKQSLTRSPEGTPAPKPSDTAVKLLRSIAEARPSSMPVAAQPDVVRQPPADLAAALVAVDAAVGENFAQAVETLEVYQVGLADRRAARLLGGWIYGRAAELRYRMGQSDAARTLWNELRAKDPLNVAALHNLAVAHTRGGDHVPAHSAWLAYLEALYVTDLVQGELSPRAPQRAAVHRALAGAFSTATLHRGQIDPDQDLGDIPPVLMSANRVDAMVAHLRLALLNQMSSWRSPTLRLGKARPAEAAALHAARAELRADLAASKVALPLRIQPLVAEGYERAWEQALAAAGGTDPHYDSEKAERVAQIVQLLQLKNRILWALRGNRGWAFGEHSGEVIGNLRKVDSLSLDPDDELVTEAVLTVAPNADPADYLEQRSALADRAGWIAWAAVRESLRDSPTEISAERYRTLVASWVENDAPEAVLYRLDDPDDLYPAVLLQAERMVKKAQRPTGADRAVVERAIAALHDWEKRLPGANGPLRRRAELHCALEQYEHARKLLVAACTNAFTDGGWYSSGLALIQTLERQRRYPDADSWAGTMLKHRPGDLPVLSLRFLVQYNWFIGLYNKNRAADGKFGVSALPTVAAAHERAIATGKHNLELLSEDSRRERARVRLLLEKLSDLKPRA